jgi:hypothetical protein
MTDLASLPADQRAVLQLLLGQGKTYEDLAGLLGIDAAGVRRRAQDALDELGPDSGRRMEDDRRALVGDYLLGQLGAAEAADVRDYLEGSAGARSWARALSGELRSLAPAGLPEIPEEGAPGPSAATPRGSAAVEQPTRPEEAPVPAAAPRAARAQRTGPALGERRSSRLGGALLLGGVAVLIVVVALLLLTGGDDDNDGNRVSNDPPSTSTTGDVRPVAQINLLPADSASEAAGLAQVYVRGRQRALIVAGQGLSEGAYALWLYTDKDKSKLLGFVPQRVGNDGRFVTQGSIPTDASDYKQLVVSRETIPQDAKTLPKTPATIVLRGDLELGRAAN